MSTPSTVFPEIRWAQRSSATEPEKNKLWITIAVPDLVESDVNVTDTHFKFTGKDATRSYALELELFAEVDPSLTRKVSTQQKVAVELRKKEAKAEYWPRLTKDTKRRPFVRTDFDKWVDEDEQDEVSAEDDAFAGAGMPGGGMPGGAGGMPGLGGAGGDGQFDMSQLAELQKLMGQSGGGGADLQSMLAGAGAGAGAGEDDEEDEENDETSTDLGDAKD